VLVGCAFISHAPRRHFIVALFVAHVVTLGNRAVVLLCWIHLTIKATQVSMHEVEVIQRGKGKTLHATQ
jgi:hypothetical protein